MLSNINIKDILFFDIETVPLVHKYSELDRISKELWNAKCEYMLKDEETPEEIYDKAGLYSEFGKIVCISVGRVRTKDRENIIRLKSFYGEDEKSILVDFIEMLNELSDSNTDQSIRLCGHNVKEFDIPYTARRILINGLILPCSLDIAGKKPWEINHLDTMELWKFGSYKYSTSLNLLTHVFGISSPKDDICGADVARIFWEKNDTKRIAKYCEKDVVATIQLFLKFKGEPIIEEKYIKFSIKQ